MARSDFKLPKWIFFSLSLLTKATSDRINQDFWRSIFFLTDTSELSSSSPSLSAYFLSTYNIFPFQIRVVSDVFFSGGDNSSEVAGVTHHAANLTPCVRLERGKTYSVSVSPAGLSLVRRWCASTIDLADCSLSCSVITGLLQASWQALRSRVLCWECRLGAAWGIQSAAEQTERHNKLLPRLCTN